MHLCQHRLGIGRSAVCQQQTRAQTTSGCIVVIKIELLFALSFKITPSLQIAQSGTEEIEQSKAEQTV